ncbi:MAG: Negative regulator of genetic competence ClpC/mecB [Candidatus Jorgensenbacteria bacterium GW2011_GWA1_48_13]|uniref:Negative regulator of genetic competence ClpC/mecB n=2 Tax=Candidatus Joergenseniibacteriota TaxID=1752739 RepID=A0A0G1YJZ2_9BACT|nr:MAG: Negative regulator of genetic competence ClpC/mecB [Candidatus Jorgensenbacteria bacterium GW2011_GWA1_48_13]KKU98847.1 MAG: ATPase AAA-2 domain protein [Candidatus Jorgensenbacteria bacterium GW2011_GWC1_48_8]KKW15322.1 MAG: Negative regulator of genetic competence ClpC/mecB [Candidatus Jorgensenbacteria bacterium GW2011_GWB1_50_10]
MTRGGEFLTRLAAYTAYALTAASAVLLFFSEITKMRWLAVLLTIFLVDRLIHLGQAEKSLNELKSENVNLAEALTPGAHKVLSRALRKARIVRQNFHLVLFKELLRERDVLEALTRLDVSPDEVLAKVEGELEGAKTPESHGEILKKMENIVLAAYENALRTKERFIETRSIFVALGTVKDDVNIAKIFGLFEVASLDLEEAIILSRFRRKFSRLRRPPSVLGGFAHRPRFLRKRVMNRSWTARPTPFLDQFSTDLTDLARAEKIGFLIGHGKEFKEMLDVVSRPGKPNALLVGEPGAGKSTMIAHLAFRMVKDDVPPVLFDKRLVQLELSSLLAEAAPEVLTDRLRRITDEVILAGNIVLFVPDIHDFFRTAEKRALNVMDILLPIVRNNAIPVIGETYPREFKEYIEPRSDFLNQFDTVRVEELGLEDAYRFLVYMSLILEREFKTVITLRAVKSAVTLAHRYFRNRLLPGSAVDLLKHALTEAARKGEKTLTEEAIVALAEAESRIPIQKAGAAETQKLLNLEELIHQKLINQEAAVKAVSRALREYRSGLSRGGGPIAAFLFVGPTGVGKTELAKTLAAIQFGSKEMMERFDMSEYQERASISRFIGAPSGERGGTLTDAVLEKPYSLILLDEFEKAHPDILNLFLQVFDDGRLTDSLGRTADFENTIIIATSNAHSEFIKTGVEKGRTVEELSEELKKKLTDYFKPELLNRFSDVIVFRSLKMAEIEKITALQLESLAEQVMETQSIAIQFDEAAVSEVARLGFSPVYGARPLRQVISEKIRGPLAEKILKKEVGRGNELLLKKEGGEFIFKVVK